jgi:hypothetical protein
MTAETAASMRAAGCSVDTIDLGNDWYIDIG